MFDLITGFMEWTGALGIFLLMLAANVIMLVPSELIMPFAGFTAAQGRMSFVLVVLAGTLGSVLGTLGWYCVGRWLGLERIRGLAARHGRWLLLSPAGIDRAEEWFERHGTMVVFLGRLIPGVPTLISMPAGVARMSLAAFLGWTALGTVIWVALLAGGGYLLQSHYARLAGVVDPVSNVLVGLIATWYLYRVVTFRPTRR